MNVVPDLEKLGDVFQLAIAPAFFLGTIAAFISLLSNRMSDTINRIRTINSILPTDTEKLPLKEDVRRLDRRIRYLHDAIKLALCAGISATALLALLFVSDFFGFRNAYGAGLLFAISTLFLGLALIRFAQDVWIGISQHDRR